MCALITYYMYIQTKLCGTIVSTSKTVFCEKIQCDQKKVKQNTPQNTTKKTKD